MKIKINGKEIEIDDSDSLTIEVGTNLSILNIVEGSNVNIVQNMIVTRDICSSNIIDANNYTGDVKVYISGNVEKVKTTNGDVSIEGEGKDIKTTNGKVTINSSVSGDVKTTNGNVSVNGNIMGKVKTVNGNIRKI